MNTLKIYDFSTPPAVAEEKLIALLAEYRAFVNKRLAQGSPYAWDNFIVPMEELDARVKEVWSPLDYRNSVAQTDELREVHMRCVALKSDFGVDMSQNKDLYDAYREMADSVEFMNLLPEQQKVILNALRDFRLAGVHLSAEDKKLYKETAQRLSELQIRFDNNLTDATNAWEKHIMDENILSGLPEAVKENARNKAEKKGADGYILTLDDSTAAKIFLFADNRALREEFFFARNTRASDLDPSAPKYDNRPIFEEILMLWHKQSQLLGFKNYTELSLAVKMAKTTGEVIDLLNTLATHAKGTVLSEYEELSTFAKERDGVEVLEPWDVNYYIEQLKNKKFSFSEKELQEYFPLPKVLGGMFTIANRLYGISLKERTDVELWHADAKFFDLYSKDNELIGGIYMDFYARPKKRGGAWMDEAVARRMLLGGDIELPVAYLTCNFTPPSEEKPSLLTHSEVTILFHEFGHGLNLLLTCIDRAAGVSGINGVEWDAVELPSQFMEGWCWEKESLDLISSHYETGAKIPDELFQKMRSARVFGEGFTTIRQVIFSLFDFRLYSEYQPDNPINVCEFYNEVFKQFSPLATFSWMRFPNTFAHIFAGGYAAGYYSYKWAEVYSDDIFSLFIRKDGTIDWSVGRKFLKGLLSCGGSRHAMENIVDVLGREPSMEAHLRKCGFVK